MRRKQTLVGNLRSSSDILNQPIIALSGYSSFRRKSKKWESLPLKLDASFSRPEQSASAKSSNRATTNINFYRWRRNPSTSIESKTTSNRIGVSRLPTNRIIFHKQSKIFYILNYIVDSIQRNPKLRPSICTIISGIVLVITGLLVFYIPCFYSRLPQWFIIVISSCGTIITFGGIIGTAMYCIRLRNTSTKSKKHETLAETRRNISVKPVAQENVNTPSNSPTIHEKEAKKHNDAHIFQTWLDIPAPKESIATVQYGGKDYRRKLPSSPIFRDGLPPHSTVIVTSRLPTFQKQTYTDSSIASDRLSSTANASSARESTLFQATASKSAPLCSSVPNLQSYNLSVSPRILKFENDSTVEKHFSFSNANAKMSNQATLKKRKFSRRYSAKEGEIHPTFFPDFSTSTFYQNPTNENVVQTLKMLTAKEIFDIYHDPLLYRSITRIKYQCTSEFGK